VRSGGQLYILDDTGGSPYTAKQRPEFHPILSFGYGATWVHAVANPAAVAAAAVSSGMTNGH
jgi:hypothetical protein